MKKILTLTTIFVLLVGNAWAQKKEELVAAINALSAREVVLTSKIDSLSKTCVANKLIIEQMESVIEMYKAQAETSEKLLSSVEKILATFEKSAAMDLNFKGTLANGLIAARQGALYGYVDKDCKWIVEPKYEDAWNFLNGSAIVRRDDKWGLIDTTGKECIPCEYAEISHYNADLYIVKVGSLLGLCKSDGTIVQPIKFTEINTITKTPRAKVCCDGLFGYLDAEGSLVIPTIYKDALSFDTNGTAIVTTKSGDHIKIDLNGNPQ